MRCSLDQFTLAHNIPAVHACASVCLTTNSCRLYCLRLRLTGNECWTFSAVVNENWNGDPASSVTFDVCYSTWYHSGDITHFVSGISVSSKQYPINSGDKAVDGFGCEHHNEWCFHSETYEDDPSWWKADLGAPRSVTTIMVYPSHSHMVEFTITLGNSSDSSENPIFAQNLVESTTGEIMNFTVTTPMIGRYLEFKTNDNDQYLMICEVKIFS
ncbi:hypothetical protein Pcinc_008001 [Petrolisthes cinctipes]|uniref:F5/8 type C domain-containing protein n=1 Tax=Petrolisthes cinctipes TaxID=88211 RepID=A0AAE1KXP7_PETCI|nr:hypothetical protein Pcinc_008001 [Petrolisthes cinctipes]